ncbi:hypothetical protein [Flavobacterium pectinovorum]|uniref:Lipoprotein n=1 Tax=Flavobacterium pectinovorum TaxID=29533 RepID=A0AB36P356_9FLAO|nr:hypothetical protein [Flavobacterium pectinovorum]OXB05662.1 hypothetical protein B0A72_06475 [Flavobacterium pectinovorum]SHM05475.1 hypothetical protein SAMN05444387_1804 [Flavobacterium pectinovorum]
MKTIKTLIFCFAATLISSCDNDNNPTNNVCDTTYVSTLITNAFTAANGYNDLTTMDLETHEYTIQINANGEICSVGYQNPSTYTGGYTMEVINTTANTSYSGVHTFSQTTLDYQSITPVLVNSGDIITVKRTILPGYTALNQTVGRLLRKSNNTPVPYPVTQGNAVFLSSNFYGAGGPAPDFAQPYIALGFKVN